MGGAKAHAAVCAGEICAAQPQETARADGLLFIFEIPYSAVRRLTVWFLIAWRAHHQRSPMSDVWIDF